MAGVFSFSFDRICKEYTEQHRTLECCLQDKRPPYNILGKYAAIQNVFAARRIDQYVSE
jgi:hypothetical protein